jgi:hypothetical protein
MAHPQASPASAAHEMEFYLSPHLRCPESPLRSGYNHEQITLRAKMTLLKLVSSSPASESAPSDYSPPLSRVFLLSPANTSAIRGQLLLNGNSEFEMAQRIRRQGAPLGELFSFISSLYFRGKLAYAEAFSQSLTGFPSTLIMTSSRGLLPPQTVIRLDDLVEMSGVPIDPADARYREPLGCGCPG